MKTLVRSMGRWEEMKASVEERTSDVAARFIHFHPTFSTKLFVLARLSYAPPVP